MQEVFRKAWRYHLEQSYSAESGTRWVVLLRTQKSQLLIEMHTIRASWEPRFPFGLQVMCVTYTQAEHLSVFCLCPETLQRT